MATMNAVTMSKALASLTEEMKSMKAYISKLESSVQSLLSAKPSVPSPSAPTSDGRSHSRKGQMAAPTSTPTTIPTLFPPANIGTLSTKAAFEKAVVTLSIPDEQAGHVVGRAGTGLRQIHDISNAKISVAPPSGSSGLRSVTIRGTAREVGDAISAIGKRLARRRIRTPKTQAQKEKKERQAFPSEQRSPTPIPVQPTLSFDVSSQPTSTPPIPPPKFPAVKIPNPQPGTQPTAVLKTVKSSSPPLAPGFMDTDTPHPSEIKKTSYETPMQIDAAEVTRALTRPAATCRGGPKSYQLAMGKANSREALQDLYRKYPNAARARDV